MKFTKFLSVLAAIAVLLTMAAASTVMAATANESDTSSVTSSRVKTLKEIQVTFKGNGGSTAVGQTEIVMETKYEPKGQLAAIENPFVNEEFPFEMWSTKDTGAGVNFKPGETIILDEDITENFTKNVVLYAIWTKTSLEEKTNTYYSNYPYGFEEESFDETVFAGGLGYTAENSFFIDGYEFTGWNTAADGSGDFYEGGDVYTETVDSDMTFYAQWELEPGYVTYMITYDANDDSLETAEDLAVVLSGQFGEYTVADCMFEGGEHFVSWNTEMDGSGDEYLPGDSITLEDDSTVLYAQWSNNPSSGSVSYVAASAVGVALASLGLLVAFKKKDH